MRRPVAVLAVALASLAAGCSRAASSPTVARTDFTPKVEIRIESASSAACPSGDSCQFVPPSTNTVLLVGPSAPASTEVVRAVPDGAVLEVTSQVTGTHRVVGTVKGTPVFDTGQMTRGNTTTVVLQTPGVVTIALDDAADGHLSLTVHPAGWDERVRS